MWRLLVGAAQLVRSGVVLVEPGIGAAIRVAVVSVVSWILALSLRASGCCAQDDAERQDR
jgi:hypothetical protein